MDRGKEIFEKQNIDINIDRLLAQRRLYSNAKKVNYFLIVLTIIIPIVISFTTNFSKMEINDKHWIYVLFTVIAILLEKIFEIYIDRCKKTAASIQEDFDTKIYPLKTNELLNTTFVDAEIIRKYSRKDRNNVDKITKVTNWYSKEIQIIPTNVAVLFCQRMNICYDQKIKKKYNQLLIFLSILTFLILLGLALSNEFSLMNFMIEVILPSIPIFTFTYKEYSTSLESIDNLQKLKEIIEDNLKSISNNDIIDEDELRRIQDRIYHNRILSPLIPDFIYSILWTKLEDQMNYSVKAKIEEMQQNTTSIT